LAALPAPDRAMTDLGTRAAHWSSDGRSIGARRHECPQRRSDAGSAQFPVQHALL